MNTSKVASASGGLDIASVAFALVAAFLTYKALKMFV